MLVLVIGDLHIPFRSHDLPLKFKKLLVPGKIQQIICTGNVCNTDYLHYLRTIAGDVHVVKGDYDDNPHFPSSLVLNHPPLRIGVLHGHQILPAGDTQSLAATARAMDADILLTGHTHKFEAFELDGRFFVNPGSATGAWHPVWPITQPSTQSSSQDKNNHQQPPTSPSDHQQSTLPVKDSNTSDAKDAAGNGKEATDADTKPEQQQQQQQQQQEKEKQGENEDQDKEEEPKEAPGPIPSFALLDIQGAVVVTYVYQLVDGEVKVEKIEYRKQVENNRMAMQRPGAAVRAGGFDNNGYPAAGTGAGRFGAR